MSIQEILPSILALMGLLAMSAYFSATETAFSAASRTRLRSLADQGDRRAELACRLSQRYDALLSAILIGNNIVNIAVASISTVLMIGLLGPELGATAATAGATVVVLIFGEICPVFRPDSSGAHGSAQPPDLALRPVEEAGLPPGALPGAPGDDPGGAPSPGGRGAAGGRH